MARKYDLIIWGASGFTGALAAEYLAGLKVFGRTPPVNWAIGGRSLEKLTAVKSELVKIDEAISDKLDILVGDSHDCPTLDTFTAQSKVVLSFVGPYAKYGTELVESCVANGCHYADLTGEIGWVFDKVFKLHESAKEKKLKIIPTCGFDSVPSDLGTLTLVEALRDEHNQTGASKVTGYFVKMKGGFSGGSLATYINLVEDLESVQLAGRIAREPQILVPESMKTNLDRPDQNGVEWDEESQLWTSPFFIAPCNSRVVRRSNALCGYGDKFVYSEMQLNKSWSEAQMNSWRAYLTFAPLYFTTLQPIAMRFLPKPGEGPSKELQRNGFYHMRYIARGDPDDSIRLQCDVSGQGDPGYSQTAKMLVEAGLCLALQFDQLPPVYGCVTPAAGLGTVYVERMKDAGMHFKISKL